VSPSCRELQLDILTDDGGECQQSWLGESERWKKSFWRLQRIFSCRLRDICHWRRVRLLEAMRFCWIVLGCSRQIVLLLPCWFDASVLVSHCCVAMFPCVTLLLLWWFVLARIIFCCSGDVLQLCLWQLREYYPTCWYGVLVMLSLYAGVGAAMLLLA